MAQRTSASVRSASPIDLLSKSRISVTAVSTVARFCSALMAVAMVSAGVRGDDNGSGLAIAARLSASLNRDSGHAWPAIPRASLVSAERVRRHSRYRARSAPACNFSRGPRASWVRVPSRNHTTALRKVVSEKGQMLFAFAAPHRTSRATAASQPPASRSRG